MDVVIVLGQRLNGPELHPELKGRVDVAMTARSRVDAAYLICSGGQSNPKVSRTEAAVMGDYAVQNGIDPQHVLLEEHAHDTIGNAYFSRLLIEELGDVDTVHVVTSCYHLPRARYVFQQCFGPSYRIETEWCHPTDSVHHGDEVLSIRRSKRFFEPIARGNLSQIRARMSEHVVMYSDPVSTLPVSQVRYDD
ncbi:YdcF family protein [Halorhabdus rudnickae]|uniref:YdcF family protein n=1 Tax=Halorhabdus rudnickae TaxID=1775544 RepID=UPI00143850E4|nr:YdcF family protein [Halorhabdus rudnickae]